jgi:hypothetical protein
MIFYAALILSALHVKVIFYACKHRLKLIDHYEHLGVIPFRTAKHETVAQSREGVL